MFKVNELLEATKGRLVQGKRDITVRGISIDSRTIRPQECFIAIKGANFDGHDFIGEVIEKRAICVIAASLHHAKSSRCRIRRQETFPKDARVTLIEVKDTIKALGDIACFRRNKFNIPIIAITGSNGKTTTKEMIALILSKRFKVLKNEGTKNNHIGLPLTLINLDSYYDIAILELGTNHPGEIEYLARICQPNIGIITNIGPAHLEYFHKLEGVFREKYTLIKNLKKPYIAILNADDGLLRKQVLKKIYKPVILGFSIRNQSDFYASDIKFTSPRAAEAGFGSEKLEFLLNLKYEFTLQTLGYYNIYNALSAIAVGRIFGIGYKDIVSKLAAFDFPRGRLNLVKLNKIRFIDDTYNSNPVSLKQALTALDNFKIRGRKIFVMGDMLELGSRKRLFHYQAGQQAAKICDVLITVGELSQLAAEAAQTSSFDIKNIFICESPQQASDILFNKIIPKEDDVVLIKGSRLMKMEEVFKKA